MVHWALERGLHMDDARAMRLALAQAVLDPREVPVGAVVVYGGQVIASAHNENFARNDALAHAEVLAIQKAQEALGTSRLKGCTLYVTLEPCPMCAGAVLMSGLERCVFAAFDTQYGCCGSVYALPMDPAFHKNTRCEGGFMETEARALLDSFFAGKRSNPPE